MHLGEETELGVVVIDGRGIGEDDPHPELGELVKHEDLVHVGTGETVGRQAPHRLEHPGFGLIAHRVEPGPVKPCSGEAVVAELGDQLMSFPGDTSPEDLELGADRAACLLGLAGHPGIQRDPHRRPAPMAGGIMVWSTRSSMATGSSQCGHSPPSPTRVEKAPQVSHRCWPNARVPQPAHSYTVIGRRGRPRAGTTITLGGAWCRRRHAVFRQASEQ